MASAVSSNGHSGPASGAIVIGANYGGLGIVRSLGRHKVPVVVLQDEHGCAAASRYTKRRVSWPDSNDSDQLDFLLSFAKSGEFDGWTIYPTTDESAALLARNAGRLSPHYCLSTPAWKSMEWAY